MSRSAELQALIWSAVGRALDGNHVGAVVSGGIDSSTITVTARKMNPYLPTFTGWYDEPGFDERPYARLVVGPNHHEVQITPDDFIEHFDDMLAELRPPIQGPGSFGQYMVAREASTYCSIVLSGEGGDELFGGYARLLKVAGEPMPPGYEDYQLPEDYPRTVEAALAYDLERLPDLLAVDDQMCAAWGLEARAPFTDPPLMAWVLEQPFKQRIGKRLLRSTMAGIVPDVILNRQDKMGFPVPLVKWAQGPLRDFVGDRIGYIPDPDKPYDRRWWYEMCAGLTVR